MSDGFSIDEKTVIKAAQNYADKRGNKNGKVDGEEASIFQEQLDIAYQEGYLGLTEYRNALESMGLQLRSNKGAAAPEQTAGATTQQPTTAGAQQPAAQTQQPTTAGAQQPATAGAQQPAAQTQQPTTAGAQQAAGAEVKPNAAQEGQPGNGESVAVKADKHDKSFVKEHLEKAYENGKINSVAELKEYLTKTFEDNSADIKSVRDEILAAIEAAEQMPHGSKEELKAMQKALDKKLKDYDMVDTIIAAFEMEQIEKEYKEVAEAFKNVKPDEGSDKLNYTQRAAKVEEALKDKLKTSYYREAYNAYLDNEMSSEINMEIELIVRSLFAEGGNLPESKKAIKEAIIAKHTEKFGEDEIFNDMVKRSDDLLEIVENHNVVLNKKVELANMDRAKLEKEFKNNKLDRYMNQHPGKEDGKVDLSAITDIILKSCGYDYVVNGTNNEGESELEHIIAGLQKEIDSTIDEKDARKLIKMAGFEIVEKDHTPKILKPLIGGAAAGAAAPFAGAALAKYTINNVKLKFVENVNNLDSILRVLVNNGYSDVAVLIEGHVQQTDLVPVRFDIAKDLMKAGAEGALVGAGLSILTGIAADLIIGNDIEFEEACISSSNYDETDPRYETLEGYLETVPEKFRPKARSIAKRFTDENGNFDARTYFNTLRQMGGLGSNVNCKESYGFKLFGEVKPVAKDPNVYATEEVENEVIYDEIPVFEEVAEDVPVYNTSQSGWEHLITKVYNCSEPNLLKKLGYNKAVAILRIVQGVDDGKYSDERMEALYQLYKTKGKAGLKPDADGYVTITVNGSEEKVKFNYVTYTETFGGMPVSMKLPDRLMGVDRCEISEDCHELKATITKKDTSGKYKAGVAVQRSNVQRQVGTERRPVGTKSKTTYYARIDGKVFSYGSAKERDAAVAAYMKAHPKAKYTYFERKEDFDKAK